MIIIDSLLKLAAHFLLFLDATIYSLISWVYQIILVLCNINILGNDLAVQDLVRRIYVILGVVVLFLLAYSLLKSMVNPDEALKGKKSPMALLKDVLISVILIAVIPSIFEFALNFQNALLTKNTIGNIILGSSSSVGSSEEIIKDGGMEIASGVLYAFIHPNYSSDKCEGSTDSSGEVTYDCSNLKVDSSGLSLTDATFDEFWDKMKASGSLLAVSDLASYVPEDVTYYYIASTVAGVFVLLVMISYCFEIAVRTIKLAVFELIAPLPILMRLLPNEQGNKTFGNWIRATISTYLEVFVRLGILFFSVLVIKIIDQNFLSLVKGSFTGEAGITVSLFAEMFLILGVILFVRQAPGMIKDITGLDGNSFSPFKHAMRGLNMLRSAPKVATQSITNTEWDKNHPIKSMLNKFKNPILDVGTAMLANHDAEYKNLKDFNRNYERITNDNLAQRRQKEAVRRARQNLHDRVSSKDRRAAYIQDFVHGTIDTKGIEDKKKMVNSVGKDVKSRIIEEAIDKNLRVKQLDTEWKNVQSTAAKAADYFERVTAENYEKLNLDASSVGSYYDATTGSVLDYNAAQDRARLLKQEREGSLKKQRDTAAFETIYGAIKGDFSYFDPSDVLDSNGEYDKAKTEYLQSFFANLESQFNSDLELAKAKNEDVSSNEVLSQAFNIENMTSAKELKTLVGDKKLAADSIATGYDKEMADARARERLYAEAKGDKKS